MLIPIRLVGYVGLWTAAVCSGVLGKQAAQVDEVHQLNADNFNSRTSRGLWMVEHYSPGCGHCRAFAPTYEKLAIAKKDYESTRGFYLGQINCQAQGDLCNEHNIKYYPQIKLYEDGVEIEQYDSDRSYDELSRYIDEHSGRYARSLKSEMQRVLSSAESGSNVANPDGISKDLGSTSLAAAIEEGPVFVKFYAPWCGHCKTLAPTWSELAQSMKGQLNVAEVNCDAHSALCKLHGIAGYPTMLFFHHGRKDEYNGARKLEKLQEFASKAMVPPEIKRIESADLPELSTRQKVFFVLLQIYSSPDDDLTLVKDVQESAAHPVPVYTSRDPELFTRTGVDPRRGSALLCFKDHLSHPVAAMSFDSRQQDSKDKLKAFYLAYKQDTVTELTSSNYDEIMKSPTRALIVLAAFKKTGRSTADLDKDIQRLEVVARAWRKGGRKFNQPVWFVWVDGIKWRKWLKQSFGINKTTLPKVVLVDPPMSEYYDLTLEKKALEFEGASIFSTLEGAYQHTLTPKYIETALERGSRSLSAYILALTEVAVEHPIPAMLVFASIFIGLVYGLQYCITRDLERSGGSSRLD